MSDWMAAPHLDLTEAELREGLTACLTVPRWVDDVAARAPYESVAELLEVARAAATPLTPDEVDQAMAHHPRIGEKVAGSGKAQAFSRAEQASSGSEDAALAAALAAGNSAYEKKFDRVFLIRAAGRSRQEILDELNRRIELDPATEIGIVGTELRDIALLRIPQLFSHLDHHSSFDESEAAR
jgi:2-oxo-4-hydroxy-4-carboxy-5-ureidoimidazoline decarboxylase